MFARGYLPASSKDLRSLRIAQFRARLNIFGSQIKHFPRGVYIRFENISFVIRARVRACARVSRNDAKSEKKK